MNRSRPRRRTGLLLACLPVLSLVAACHTVGPESIARGRAAYTDVITRTNDEQLLITLVRLRYGEATTMLMVTAVNSQVEWNIGSGIQVGVGPSNTYDGNLVPFSIDSSYRESPTISYQPLSGEHYLKELVTPISLDLFGLLVDNAADTEWMLKVLTASLAGLDNPVHYESARASQLARALELMAGLRRAGALSFAYEVDDDDEVRKVELVIDYRAEATRAQATELLELVHQPLPEPSTERLHLPLQMGRLVTGPQVLRLQTRSTLELMHLAARGVEVPEGQLQAGIAAATPAASASAFLHVSNALEPPVDPFVAVQYRGYWFWIESNDTQSKRGFVTMQMLLQSCLSDERDRSPQLTLPMR